MNYIMLIGEDQEIYQAKELLAPDYKIDSIIYNTNDWKEQINKRVDDLRNKSLDIVVCASKYLDIGKYIFEKEIPSYYVFLDGWMYLCDLEELMQPIELYDIIPFKKKKKTEKCILYVRDNHVTNEEGLAGYIKGIGYTTILLRIGRTSEKDNALYDICVSVSSMKGVRNFIESSEIDIVHCFSGTNVVAGIAMLTDVPIIYEVNADNISKINMILEHMIYNNCAGVVFRDNRAKEIYEKQFGKAERYIYAFESENKTVNCEAKPLRMEDFYGVIEEISQKA